MDRAANPVMITLARESRGISQKVLAERLGEVLGREFTQAAVSKLESGQLHAVGGLLTALSQALGYPESFFCRQYEVYPPGMGFYRKHKTLPAKVANRIEAVLNIFRLHVSQLLLSAEIEFTPIPECDIDEYGSAREVARAVRQYLKLPRGPVKNVTEILEKMGIVVVPFDPKTMLFSGVSLLVNTENYIILINSQMPGDRFRWTLVHELAHIIMHRLPSDRMEAEADEFAGEFLMPYEEIAPDLKNLTVERLAALKRRWMVSMSGILTHGHKTIGLISDWHQRQLRIELASNGITRTQEPRGLDIPVEQPVLLSELVDFHFNELSYSLAGISELVGLHEADFLRTYKPALPKPTAVPKHRLSLVPARKEA
jgi:Zn-dependent peptidase ImmA (M78 family)